MALTPRTINLADVQGPIAAADAAEKAAFRAATGLAVADGVGPAEGDLATATAGLKSEIEAWVDRGGMPELPDDFDFDAAPPWTDVTTIGDDDVEFEHGRWYHCPTARVDILNKPMTGAFAVGVLKFGSNDRAHYMLVPLDAPAGRAPAVFRDWDGTDWTTSTLIRLEDIVTLPPTSGPAAYVIDSTDVGNEEQLWPVAAVADLYAGTEGRIVGSEGFAAWAYQTPEALTPGATVTPDCETQDLFTLAIDQTTTLANPDNMQVGQEILIVVTQDSTPRTMTAGSDWDFPAGLTLSAGSGDLNVIYGRKVAADQIVAFLVKPDDAPPSALGLRVAGFDGTPTTITSAAEADWDLAVNNLFAWTPANADELQNPSNQLAGMSGRIFVVANSETVTFDTAFTLFGGGELPADGTTDAVIYFDVVAASGAGSIILTIVPEA